VTSLASVLERIAADLTTGHVRFALIGGLAVSVRTEPRFTRDADLAVAVSSDEEAEAVLRHLQTGGYHIINVLEQSAACRLATARLTPAAVPSDAPVLDLLFASSGIEPEIATDAEALDVLPGIRMPVARTGHLIALKVLSRNDVDRPQDIADLRALLRVASREELALARTALALIEARGYNRGRPLQTALDELL